MRGKILGFDAAGGTGAISGGDGKRYTFTASEWRGDGSPTPGVYVDFDAVNETEAKALFPEVKTVFAPGRASMPEPAAPPAPPPPPSVPHSTHPGPAQGQPGGYPPPPQGGYGAPGGPPPYPQPGAASGGYPQPGARPPYPGQPPQQSFPGQQARPPYPGQGGPSENYPGAGGYPGQPYQGQKSKIAAGLLALFLGPLGVHKFYLGYTQEGVMLLVGAVLAIPLVLAFGLGVFILAAIRIITFVEAIIYLTKSDQDFDMIYVQHKKPWF